MTTGQSVPPPPPWLLPLQRALADPDQIGQPPQRELSPQPRRAAVLILIGEGDEGPEMVFVERAATLRAHPGQIAFPGGAMDPDDPDLIATAERETAEEVGVAPSEVSAFGALPATQVAVSGFDVTAVLAWWHLRRPLQPVDLAEVAAVHQVPIAMLADPANRVRIRHPSGYTGPGFEIGEITIWGLTAHFTDAVLRLGGWDRPWNRSRLVPVPQRHLHDHQKGNAS